MISLKLQPEYIFSFLDFGISNTFFTSFLVTIFLSLGALFFYSHKKERGFLKISFYIFTLELLRLIDSVIKNKEISKRVFPLVATFFIFITCCNLFSLVPGFLGSFYIKTERGNLPLLKSPNSDLNTTLALALFSVFFTQVFVIRNIGFRGYLLRFFNFLNPIKLILGIFELISEFTRILSLSFRLFGNILSGEILLLLIIFLFPLFLPLPFLLLEFFIGIIQAFIFSVITLSFISLPLRSHLKGR